MANVLIAGCGLLGSHVARELVGRGHRVWGLRRTTSALPAGVLPIAADLTERPTLGAIPREVDHVVYAAAADSRAVDDYERAYVVGLTNVLDELRTRGQHVERFVFTSSTAVYGQCDGEWVDERAEANPSSATGQLLLRAESLVRSVPPSGVSLRLSGIYGPGRTRFLTRVLMGEARRPVSVRYSNRIHVEDAARAVSEVLLHPAPEPVYNVTDDDPADLREVIAWIAQSARRDVPPSEETQDGAESRSHKRCRNALLKALPFALRYPTYREGYAALLEEHRLHESAP